MSIYGTRVKEKSLENFLQTFPDEDLAALADNVTDPLLRARILDGAETLKSMIKEYFSEVGNASARVYSTSDTSQRLHRIRELCARHKFSYSNITSDYNRWAAHREKLIEKLDKKFREIDMTRTQANKRRIIGAVGDIASIASGFAMKYYGSSWAEYALWAASAFTGLGILSTVKEVMNNHEKFKEIKALIEKDKKYFKPIRKWLEETRDLEAALSEIFPSGFDPEILNCLQNETELGTQGLTILEALIISNINKDRSIFQSQDFWMNVKDLFTNPEAYKCLNLVLFTVNPIILHSAKFGLQLLSSPAEENDFLSRILLSASHPVKNPKLYYTGRVLVDALTAYGAIEDLRERPHSERLQEIEEFLDQMRIQLIAFNKINNLMTSS